MAVLPFLRSAGSAIGAAVSTGRAAWGRGDAAQSHVDISPQHAAVRAGLIGALKAHALTPAQTSLARYSAAKLDDLSPRVRIDIWLAAANTLARPDAPAQGVALAEHVLCSQMHLALSDLDKTLQPLTSGSSVPQPELLRVAQRLTLLESKPELQQKAHELLRRWASPHADVLAPAPKGQTASAAGTGAAMPRPIVKGPMLRMGAALAAADHALAAVKIGPFAIPGRPELDGLITSTFDSGSYAKVRLLRTHAGELFAVRMVRTEPQHTGLGPDAPVRSTNKTTKSSHLRETEALRLVDSHLHPLASGEDERGRIFDVVPLYSGHLGALMDGLAPAARPAVLALAAERGLHAVAALEANDLVHGDIKPDNFLWRPDGEIVLADYGLARSTFLPSKEGTQLYAAPEAVADKGSPAPKYDAYSLGLTLVALTIGGPEMGRFPLTMARGSKTSRDAFGAWLAQRAGTPDPALKPVIRRYVARIEEAYQAMAELDAGVADLVFFQLLQPEPRDRGEAGRQLLALQADGRDRRSAVLQHRDALEAQAAAGSGSKKIVALTAALHAAAQTSRER